VLCGVEARAADRPNIIVILIDDLGGHDLGCYGSRFYRTPHIDRLAQNGMLFTDAYAACPVCSPTRAALLTGKYPARYNLTDWLTGRPDRPDQKLLRPTINQQLPRTEKTLAEVLKAAGYATGHIGKWHLGGEGFGPRQRGFDVNIGGSEAGSPFSYIAPFKNKQGRFMPGLEQAPDGEYLTDRLTAEAEQFIDRHRDQPFFLYLAHYAVHIPLRARAELIAHYSSNGKPGEQNNRIYSAMIESVDDGVGRLVQKLKDRGLAQRTVLFFTSDNGGLSVREGPDTPSTINSPLREGKGYLYEGGIRVPLLIQWPGVTRGGQISHFPVCSIDFFPTILAMCGVAHGPQVDGVSLVPLLQGKEGPARDALYWHYPHYSNQGGRPGGIVRAGDYKLIEFFEQDRRELYNLRSDVSENRNLADEEPVVVNALAAKLQSWRRAVGAREMRPNPAYVPNPQAADGTITLPARTADVQGVQLRYEPLPHKDTLGYWTRVKDWARWEFELTRPGAYTVEVLQGCGAGQGGSMVWVTVAGRTLTFTVEDTGHFQNFKKRTIGTVKFDQPGRYTLTVKPQSKPPVGAVMDLRSVVLKPAAR
jgi:arylsulfatase A-like enzyme